MQDRETDRPRQTRYEGQTRYKGMNPTVAILGLGAVFVILAFLMIARDSPQNSSTSDLMNRPTPSQSDKK